MRDREGRERRRALRAQIKAEREAAVAPAPTQIELPAGWGLPTLTLSPLVLEGDTRAPCWVLLVPVSHLSPEALFADPSALAAQSAALFGDAVTALNRYAAAAAKHMAGDDGPLSRDLPANAAASPAPGAIKHLRETNWPMVETMRTCFRADHLATELRGYSITGGKPGGILTARVHLHLATLPAHEANALLWPAEAQPPSPL